jgi:hypothetical protein
MFFELTFYVFAAISIFAAAWLFFSRSTIALIVTAVGLAGVFLCTAHVSFVFWRLAQANGITFFADSWKPVTYRFLLPLTASIIASSIAMCIHWRRRREVHDAA